MKDYYKINADYLFDEDNGWYHGYGITLIKSDGERLEVRDISCDEAKILELVQLFNEEELQPVHFADAIEDAIG